MAEGLVEAFVEEISTLEGPARMTDFFNAFYKKHGTDKVGLREALGPGRGQTPSATSTQTKSSTVTFTRFPPFRRPRNPISKRAIRIRPCRLAWRTTLKVGRGR